MSFFSKLSTIFNAQPGAHAGQNQGQKKQQSAPPVQKQQPAQQQVQKPVQTQQSQPQQPIQQQQKPQQAAPLTPQPQLETLVREAQARAREIIVEAKDEALRIKEQAESDLRVLRKGITDKENSIDQKLNTLDNRLKTIDEKEQQLLKRKTEIDTKLAQLDETRNDLIKKLEGVAGLSREQAKQQLLDSLGTQLAKESAQMIQAAEASAKEEADAKAQEILVDAVKHGATEYIAEYTVSTVQIPNDEAKGRIIGKDGRNIRAFERYTGVDIELDDEPGQIRLSSFDPVRREVARITLERLIKDGRIQPTRIEETVNKVRSELEKIMFEEGKKLCHAVGVYSLPTELIQLLGKFKYRFSYGQNLIAHTLEETKIGIALANELKADVEIVKLGCLLHDIGKVVDSEEGSHVELGVNLLKKYNIPQQVIDCVEQHHEDTPFTSKEAIVVYTADAVSGARPGARYENYDEYVKRLQKLEDIAMSNNAVREAYAIQAGREVRVILSPEQSTDDDAVVLAHSIKQRIEKEMTYPGTVTVTVVREIRAVDVAK
jgi:ribonuclease Y